MKKILAAIRRFFGATKKILDDIFMNVVPEVMAEVRRGNKSDAEIRQVVERAVKNYIAARWPAYSFLTDKAVELVFEFVRDRLRGRIN